MRVRATRGIRFSAFYGNYFVRGADLLALPNCSTDSSFSLDMAYDETVLSAQATQLFLLIPTNIFLVVIKSGGFCIVCRRSQFKQLCYTHLLRESDAFGCTPWLFPSRR